MFGHTDTVEQHKEFTRNEWLYSDYYKNTLIWLKKFNPKIMIDAGACAGESTFFLFDNIQSLNKSFLIEPIKSNFDFISERIKNDERFNAINKALYYGDNTIKIGNNSGVGSYSMLTNQNCVEYKTITLEEITNHADFIKIDIEGSEYNVIENSKLLKNISILEIEFHNNFEYNVVPNKSRYDIWKPFIEKHLPDHIMVEGGNNKTYNWYNTTPVVYDGSGLFIHKNLLNTI